MDFINNIDIKQLIIMTIVLIISIVGHEIAHGWVAYKFGDNTAKNLGRLSINPINHIDPLGTIVVPALMYLSTGLVFGWAKPVPIAINTVIRNGGYKGAIAVALAGITYNLTLFVLAFFAFGAVKATFPSQILAEFLYILFTVNLILALFNLYPIPPLDGSKALEYVFRIFRLHALANSYANSQRYGFIILIIIMISPFKEQFFYPIGYVLSLVRFLL
ncbi:site-2 protease family protein [Campylobacter sp. faydin G-140]|uniref:site-2 protease family protein n=1 Tax=Campylobacter anatolicus TaxID=2829105 RepID=UPI001B9AE633|nr:site-2 protease family protein [Campylobacter anatolicus]MBR8464947.1 site-2 protease family protein [Campylobacter anatolicus]